MLEEFRLYGRASGAKLNQQKTEGLWIGSWRGRQDEPYGFSWKSTRIKALGIWVGDSNAGTTNFEEQYVAVLAKLRTWKTRNLSELGKVRAANMFLYSRFWYRTAIFPPLQRKDNQQGYEDVERQVASWVFRGRQEVAAARLKDSYESGGAQLVDIKDKVRAQRVSWLARLLSMPRGAYPRVVAGALIGQQNAGYYGLDTLLADISKLGLPFIL